MCITFQDNRFFYQYCRIPFGITNKIATFQQFMDKLEKENCKVSSFTFDNIIIAGDTEEEPD